MIDPRPDVQLAMVCVVVHVAAMVTLWCAPWREPGKAIVGIGTGLILMLFWRAIVLADMLSSEYLLANPVESVVRGLVPLVISFSFLIGGMSLSFEKAPP